MLASLWYFCVSKLDEFAQTLCILGLRHCKNCRKYHRFQRDHVEKSRVSGPP